MRQLSGTELASVDEGTAIEHEDAYSLESGTIEGTETSSSISSIPNTREAERRREERDLILQYDSEKLHGGQAWFLVETSWLNKWMEYVMDTKDGEPSTPKPGPLTNFTLFDPIEFCVRPDLVATRDYRGVTPQVYALYTELYGAGDTRPIVRWTIDIYSTPVMIDDVRDMLYEPRLKAKVEVSELLEEFEPPRLIIEKEDRESWVYRCCCRCEFLVPCLSRLMLAGPTYATVDESSETAKRLKKLRGKKRDDSSDEEEQGLLS